MALESIERKGLVHVVQDTERKFPGLLVQGDTLATLLDDLEEELPDGLATIRVREWLGIYEEVLHAAGIRIPYVR